VPKDLLRAAIFGHVRGAFTGAEQDRPGLLRETEEGTLLLDEFGEFGLSEQAVLLRVLEAGEYFRVGEETARTLKTRLVLTTNRSIDDERVFRPDLKYRCKLIRVPALSERVQEIGPLASYFANGKGAGMTEAGVAWCEGQAWPGNVRQLKSVVEEAASVCAGGDVTLKALANAAQNFAGVRTSAPPSAKDNRSLVLPGETMAQALKRIERTFAEEALAQAGTARGRKSRAAAIYGANRHTFYDLLERYNLS
jgi:DNA-binding NtrC family response regulator